MRFYFGLRNKSAKWCELSHDLFRTQQAVDGSTDDPSGKTGALPNRIEALTSGRLARRHVPLNSQGRTAAHFGTKKVGVGEKIAVPLAVHDR